MNQWNPQPPYPYTPNQGGVPVVATKTNVPAMVGFWLAIGSYLTCGVLGIPALIVSAIGVREEPKGYAIAGIFISLPSVAWSIFWLFAMIGASHLPAQP